MNSRGKPFIGLFLISVVAFLPPQTVWADVEELKNLSWQEVPGTASLGSLPDPAYIDVNNMTKEGTVITFDMVDSVPNYSRMQVNCQDYQHRNLRYGFFISPTEVDYDPTPKAWSNLNSSDDYQYLKSILEFACQY